jgi:hypothetical protein
MTGGWPNNNLSKKRQPVRRFSIRSGRLNVQIHRQEIPLDYALDFAARRNPKRPFLFVSKLLGRHLPTRPHILRETAHRLAAKIASGLGDEPVLFFGMAETATALGQTVFQAWTESGREGLYLDTTRRRTGGRIAFRFREAHSHAIEHLVHLPTATNDPMDTFQRARTVVLIDDEATTGRTALSLVRAYERHVGHRVRRCLAVIANWLAEASGAGDLEVFSLLEGRIWYEPGKTYEKILPPPPPMRQEPRMGNLAPRGSRHGVRFPQKLSAQPEFSGDKVLVVGVGEFHYLPFLFAETLEKAGVQVWVQATTRSPIELGGVIRHICEFTALTGEGYREYLYNVPPDHTYDQVVVCDEDGLEISQSHPLWRIPRLRICRLISL